ncbi:MAG: hypothetical protein K1X79_09445 [Oligoflexia bacterium]|nr:hypothetical protein [Oligoflexia bacterium]
MAVKDQYDEIFKVEIEGWCYGLSNYPGEIFPGLIHRVIKELSPSFREALEHGVAFNILEISQKFSKAAKYLVHEKEIAFSILSQFPHPASLTEDAQFVMAQIIDQVEQTYGGALERLHKKWGWEKRQAA